jgi:LmbE family N-acetylglucosaminyl deacetylase
MIVSHKFLLVAAHPDDEILGAGGSVARLVEEGWQGRTLILGEGLMSRKGAADHTDMRKDLDNLKQNARDANACVGIQDIHFASFPDNRFDHVDLLDIVKVIEGHVDEYQPELVFTQYDGDLNIDHRCTYDAVLAATRPQPGHCVREVLAYEVLSSTEWRYPQRFSPNVFYDTSATLERKLNALKQYVTEMRDFPHARSLEAVEHLARLRGAQVGLLAAEAFFCCRSIR